MSTTEINLEQLLQGQNELNGTRNIMYGGKRRKAKKSSKKSSKKASKKSSKKTSKRSKKSSKKGSKK